MADIGRVLAQTSILTTQTAVTTGGRDNAGSQYVGCYTELLLTLNVTAISGTTPSLTVFIDTAEDGGPQGMTGSRWINTASFAAQTAISGDANNNADHLVSASITLGRLGGSAQNAFGQRIRARWTLTGTTPSASFTVTVCGK